MPRTDAKHSSLEPQEDNLEPLIQAGRIEEYLERARSHPGWKEFPNPQ